jgi:hypothetical protein
VTLLDEWPELEMEMDSDLIACDDGKRHDTLQSFDCICMKCIQGEHCKRKNCVKHRARNPRTGIPFDYCSLKCLRLDRTEQLERG